METLVVKASAFLSGALGRHARHHHELEAAKRRVFRAEKMLASARANLMAMQKAYDDSRKEIEETRA